MEDHDLLDSGFVEQEEREILAINNFIFLFLLTLGLYGVWWMYKSWKFFQEKDNLDIMPAMRAIFSIFFLYGLFERIQSFAQSKGYTKNYSSAALFIAFVLFNLLSRLPDPMWIISILAFVFLIPPFNALNYAMLHSEEYRVIEREGFNQKQIVLVVFGILWWALILLGLFVEV